jgi:hypothetical protein
MFWMVVIGSIRTLDSTTSVHRVEIVLEGQHEIALLARWTLDGMLGEESEPNTHRDIRTGRPASYKTVRVTPPNIHSLRWVWP